MRSNWDRRFPAEARLMWEHPWAMYSAITSRRNTTSSSRGSPAVCQHQ